MNTAPLMYPISDAAKRLGIGRTLFYALLKQREVVTVKIGSRTVVPAAELQKLADDLTAEARAKANKT